MKSVQLRHYAVFREQRGIASESYDTQAHTLGELYEEIAMTYGFTLPKQLVRAALNNEFVDIESLFNGGDEIVFIPPVAGG